MFTVQIGRCRLRFAAHTSMTHIEMIHQTVNYILGSSGSNFKAVKAR